MASFKLHDVMTKLTENHLTCSICMSTFTDPRILDCNHSYCLTCLQNLETQPLEDVDLSSELKCPICREMTSLNEMGADGLKHNFTLKSLQDDIIYQQNLLNKDSVEMLNSHPKNQCQRHPHQEYCLYCLTFSVLICAACTTTTHIDLDHLHLQLSDAEKTCRTELLDLLSQSLDRVCHLTATMSLIENEREKMNDTVDAAITPDFERLLGKFREERDKEYSKLLSSASSKVEWAAQAHFNVLKKVTEACMYDLLETREEFVLRLKDVIQKEFPSKTVPSILEIKLKSEPKFGLTSKHTYEISITETDCYIDKESKIVMGKPQTKTIK